MNILEKSKKKLVFELRDVDHTICNALKEELWNDDKVDAIGYNIDHPLVGVPRFVLQMKSGDAFEALDNAVKRLKKVNDKFKAEFKKALS